MSQSETLKTIGRIRAPPCRDRGTLAPGHPSGRL